MCKRGRLHRPGPSRSGRLIYAPREVASPSTAFDRNLTATGCPSLSLCVSVRNLDPDKSAVLSSCVPLCLPVSLKENDYEQRRSQVRVLPSAPKKAPQIAGFCS